MKAGFSQHTEEKKILVICHLLERRTWQACLMWEKSLFVDVAEIIQGQFTHIKNDPCITAKVNET